MNVQQLATDFLRWLATQDNNNTVKQNLDFYLKARGLILSAREYNQVLYIVRQTIKRLGEN